MATTTIAELSIADFKNLIRETVNETIIEFFSDPDEGLMLREEVAEYIHTSIKKLNTGNLETTSAEDVAKNLGLEW